MSARLAKSKTNLGASRRRPALHTIHAPCEKWPIFRTLPRYASTSLGMHQPCPEPDAGVHRLSLETACRVRACARLPTIEYIVHALLDAAISRGAAHIHLDVDLQAWRIVCSDDGPSNQDILFLLASRRVVLDPHAHGIESTPPISCMAWISLLEVSTPAQTLLQRVRVTQRPTTDFCSNMMSCTVVRRSAPRRIIKKRILASFCTTCSHMYVIWH